jgi:outer membrane protein OmpA-like peptidoglycan-associated protein
MIKKRLPSLLFVLIFAFFTTSLKSQNSINNLLNTAKKNASKLDYPNAIKNYKLVLAQDEQNGKAQEGLIDIYLYKYEIYDSALVYINKRIENQSLDTNFQIFYDKGNCLRLQEKPYEAIETYLFFKTNGLKLNKLAYLESNVNDYLAACRYAIKNKNTSVDNNKYSVKNMDFFINSVDPEYTPVFIEDEGLLLYNARYKDFEDEQYTNDNKYYENIYYFDLEESAASSYNPGIQQDDHHAVIGKNPDSDTILIFYQNKIWTSSLTEDRLNNIKPLPEILSNYYFQPHGIFTNYGNTIIFSAMEKPEELGGDLNIYISNKENGKWTKPVPLSPIINSEKNEDSPYLSKDGKTLYFSSKGHNSSGGYDFYKSELIDGEWSYPVNLGYPMNSAGDDIYLSFTKDEKNGYFSSNRNGGFGGMDIYSFEVDKKTIQGIAKDKNGQPLSEVVVTLINTEDKSEIYATSNEEGTFEFKVDADKNFNLLGEKKNYFEGVNTVNTFSVDNIIKTSLTLEKDPGISLYILVTDAQKETPLDSVKMLITDNLTGASEEYFTNLSGDYRKPLPGKKLNDRGSFNFTFSREGYLSKTVTYNTLFQKEGSYKVHNDLDISLTKIKVGEDLSKIIDINPIYFDVNKAIIKPEAALELDKIVSIMNENPNMVVELGSHTDARGSAKSNKSLSDRRAESSANYIKERITNPSRISGRGYGEERLVNGCSDGVTCTKDEHQLNRRTEFIIVRL